MMAPCISLVVAMSENRVIGRDNALPWRLSEDLKHFKKITLGKPVIMGRKTYDSIGRPLPGRTNIVITRDPAFTTEGIRVAHALDDAIDIAMAEQPDEIMVIGGAQIYALALPRAGRIYLTKVHATIEGDTFFPALDVSEWREFSREDHTCDDHAADNRGSTPAFSFLTLERHS